MSFYKLANNENVVDTHYGILFNCKEKWNEISKQMDDPNKDYIE